MSKTESNNTLHYISLTPLFGISVFLILYVLAATLYPGGSDIQTNHAGFDLVNNYWCDLMSSHAKNNELNPARPIAITAWFILGLSLIFLWYFLPRLFHLSPRNNFIIRYFGITSMVIALFLFTRFHDLVLNTSGILGSIAILTTCIELKRQNLNQLLYLGVISLVLLLVNYAIYHTNYFMYLLPLLQKITFLLFLIWIILIDLHIHRSLNWKKTGKTT
jgi:hypothetical protein